MGEPATADDLSYLFTRVAMACGKSRSELLSTERLGVILSMSKQIIRADDVYFLKLQSAMMGAYTPMADGPVPQNEAERQWQETERQARRIQEERGDT